MGNIDLPELATILKTLDKILLRLELLQSPQLPEWVDLETACAWKGVNPKTIQQPGHRHLMPPLKDRELVGGRLKWPRDVIMEWAKKVDEKLEIEAGHRQFKIV